MTETVGMVFDRIEAQQALALSVGPEANSLDFLQMVYRNSSLPLATRMRAAIYCLPFETPKLLATAIVNEGSFAEILDRRIARIQQMKLLEASGAKIIDAQPQPVETKPPIARTPDRRFRRF